MCGGQSDSEEDFSSILRFSTVDLYDPYLFITLPLEMSDRRDQPTRYNNICHHLGFRH